MTSVSSVAGRVGSLDWSRIRSNLDDVGCAVVETLLTPTECADLVHSYDDAAAFRSRVIMAQHAFGRGEYQYFAYPLPPLVSELRTHLYPHVAEVANDWNRKAGNESRYPADHSSFLERCHAAGQKRPTPLLLKYAEGDFNCLHQDIYGELVFPLQLTFLLSAPQQDFTGGEFVLTEQRPRMQSRVEVVPLHQGEALVFAVNQRPVRGKERAYNVRTRHGVSRVRSGRRFTLGIIFHDAA